jgi:NACalpha-BTF3-like transcription factor
MGKTHKHEKSEAANDRKSDKQSKKDGKYDKKEKRKGRGIGNAFDTRELNNVLADDGLTIHVIDGDGNCLFRSIADQITGDQELHMAFRTRIMKYIKDHADHFRLFMEDDESFEAYMDRMTQGEEWGGHQELYAASQCLNVNITVYQLNAPSYILPANPNGKGDTGAKPPKDIRISYHGDCHYNSVKSIDGYNDTPVQLSASAARRAAENAAASASVSISTLSENTAVGSNSTASVSSATKSKVFVPDADITTVLQSVPWVPREQVVRALELKAGDVDAAVEYLCADVEELSIDTPVVVEVSERTDGTSCYDAGAVAATTVNAVDTEVKDVHPANSGGAGGGTGPNRAECTVVPSESIAITPDTTHPDNSKNMAGKAKNTRADSGTAKKEKSYRKSGQLSSKPLSKKVLQ